jgi:spermidine synthase
VTRASERRTDLRVELLADAGRDQGRWLLVDGSEQSYVDLTDPTMLEFEYVQMIAVAVDAWLAPRPAAPATARHSGTALHSITALHLGGGLCTVPRWLAATRPGIGQHVVERSVRIAGLAAGLGLPAGLTLHLDDARRAVHVAAPHAADLLVCDVYDGPDTVADLLTRDAVDAVRAALRSTGGYAVNLSDAAPFALARAVTATVREVFGHVVVLAEPAVLRGRHSGNLVVAAADHAPDVERLGRLAAAGPVRMRLLVGAALDGWLDGVDALRPGDVPPRSAQPRGPVLFSPR